MKWHRIWAMVVRHLRQLPSDFNKLSSIVYWPFLDIVIFGFVGAWIDVTSGQEATRWVLLTNVALWQVVVRADFGVSLNLLEEIWSQNVTNLFSTPLTIAEWIWAVIVEGLIMLVAITIFCSGVIYFLYNYNIFMLGFWLFPIVFLMFISGLAIGFFTSSLLILWGVRVQALAWMLGWIFAPVSGAYNPTSVLPLWLQTIAHGLPFHYATASTQVLLVEGQPAAHLLIKGYILGLFYLSLSILFFVFMFNKSKERGLHRLKD